MGIIASFKNLSDRSNKIHEVNTTDETRGKTPEEVFELSVPQAYFDRQLHTHHS